VISNFTSYINDDIVRDIKTRNIIITALIIGTVAMIGISIFLISGNPTTPSSYAAPGTQCTMVKSYESGTADIELGSYSLDSGANISIYAVDIHSPNYCKALNQTGCNIIARAVTDAQSLATIISFTYESHPSDKTSSNCVLAQSSTPTPTPTDTPAPTPTQSPTSAPIDTPVSTAEPTSTPIAPVATPTPQPSLPSTGIVEDTAAILILGISLLGIGTATFYRFVLLSPERFEKKIAKGITKSLSTKRR
jgi:LPXTG-motif cell wall-anchored protein